MRVFEEQIRQKYVKYQEPVEEIDFDIVAEVIALGVYPRDHIVNSLNKKEQNYATATYNLFIKKRQLMLES